MKILLDTHFLIWSFVETAKINKKLLRILEDEENEVYYSQASLWEIAIKYKLGKLKISEKGLEAIYEEIAGSHLLCRRFENEDLMTFHKLPIEHRDPFDRIIIWQAIRSNLQLLSVDGEAENYKKYGLKILK